jgi:hypothetical protein
LHMHDDACRSVDRICHVERASFIGHGEA